VATFAGGSGSDTFTGGTDSDTISGGGGADTLSGDGGDDFIYSADVSPPFNRPYFGNPWTAPVLDVGIEHDILSGGTGNDSLFAGYGDSVDGGDDYDTLYISFQGATAGVTVDFRDLYNNGSINLGGGTLTNIESVAWVQGSEFGDTITDSNVDGNFAPTFGMGGDDHLIGGYYSGNVYGGDGNDYIDRTNTGYGFEAYGDAGNDTIIGGSGYESLYGGTGDDNIQGNYGFDNLYGEDGNDTLDGGLWADNLYGGDGNDTMYGADDGDVVEGNAGDDTIYGDYSPLAATFDGSDRLWGGAGADVIHGDGDADYIWSGDRDAGQNLGLDDAGLEHDQLFGDDGNDFLAIGYGDDADGGTGSDTLRISLAGATSGVAVDTHGFTSGGTWSLYGGTIQNIETLDSFTGSSFSDIFIIATQPSLLTIYAGDGNDIVIANGSSVSAQGGDGNDFFFSGSAGDIFDGGNGIDAVSYANYASGVTVTLGDPGFTGTGPGGDQLTSIERVFGSNYADTLNGGSGNDELSGGDGNDTLNGGGGNDILIGQGGSDTLAGGAGDDVYDIDAQDVVNEFGGGGYDTVRVNFSYVLAPEVERAVVSDPTSTNAINLTGNTLGNELTGNAGVNWIDGGAGADVMSGLGGNDTYYVDNAGDQVLEASGGGFDTVFTTVSYSLGSMAERLAAYDPAATTALSLTGNGLNNQISGNAGANVIDGGTGADLMTGLGGDDIYFVDNGADRVVEQAGGGYDTIYVNFSYTLGSDVERLLAYNPAATIALHFTGNELDNEISANAGANLIDGGAGADTMSGQGGSDFYYVDNAGDRIIEQAGGGYDTVFTSVSYTLGAEVDRLVTLDPASTAALNLTGNALPNEITGNAGANVIDGGAGADLMAGAAGDDTYLVDNAGDRVAEASGGGYDTVFAGVSYAITSDVERLVARDANSTTALNLTGNELVNEISGNAGANHLDGGAGADVMLGGGGDDVYFVDNSADQAVETAGGGYDTVYASVDYTLSSAVDRLVAYDPASTAPLHFTGNELANEISGNAGANVIDGGAGADVMLGGGGDDIYFVDNSADQAVEAAGAGYDTVYASVSYTLSSGVDRVVASDPASADALHFTGNELANEISGNAGANLIDGGAGADILTGLGGSDAFEFSTALGGGNVDSIADFQPGTDHIYLDHSVFSGLATGALAAGAFQTGATATEADDRVVYDSATGALYFDADGSGAGAAVQFAHVSDGLSLAAGDFAVI
jgi:Ca2+-binding RTX toxin-like protein